MQGRKTVKAYDLHLRAPGLPAQARARGGNLTVPILSMTGNAIRAILSEVRASPKASIWAKRVEKAKGRILIDGPAIKTKMTKDEARESLVLVVPQ